MSALSCRVRSPDWRVTSPERDVTTAESRVSADATRRECASAALQFAHVPCACAAAAREFAAVGLQRG